MNRRYNQPWGHNNEPNRSNNQVKTCEWPWIMTTFCLHLWKLARTLTRCIMGRASSPPCSVVVNLHPASVLSSCYSWYQFTWNCLQLEFSENHWFKAGVNVKAVFTSLNTAFLPISRSRFKRRQIPMLITLSTIWQFCVNFWVIFRCFGKERFFLKG